MQLNIKYHFWIILCLVNSRYLTKSDLCEIPGGCKIRDFYYLNHWDHFQDTSTATEKGVVCEVKNRKVRRFDFDSWLLLNQTEMCRKENFMAEFEIKFFTNKKVLLDIKFNLQGVFDFFKIFFPWFYLKLSLVKGFSADLGVLINQSSYTHTRSNLRLDLINSKLDFYLYGKLIRSCKDLLDANLTTPRSIFQLALKNFGHFFTFNCIFKHPICPLIFKNSQIEILTVSGMANFFYKKNILSFTNNNTFDDLNSEIRQVVFHKCEHVDFDSSLINPFVFKYVQTITIYDDVRSIGETTLGHFRRLSYIQLECTCLRGIVYKHGIKWMRAINWFVRVNMSDPISIKENLVNETNIQIRSLLTANININEIFPDKDFCLYLNFPFDQFVVITIFFQGRIEKKLKIYDFNPSSWNGTLSCTSWWLFQYYPLIRHVFRSIYIQENFTFNISNYPDISSCNFTKMIYRCKKKSLDHFRPKLIFDHGINFNISKSIHYILNILIYIIPFFGLCTNSLVIWIINGKRNRDIFSDFKQFDYLSIISIFNILILIIQLFSFFTDCSLYTQFVCLNFRKHVWVQLFKIIFKEVLVVALRFMINFAYIGFSFNRILLIGKDHPKFMTKISNCSIKKFILISGLISLGLSFVKGFKYRVNYDHAEKNYPFNNEYDISTHANVALGLYFLFNGIVDILNYVVFVFISLIIDIYMLIRLRRTLKEKLARLEALKQNNVSNRIKNTAENLEKNVKRGKTKKKTKELDMKTAMDNAAKMVIVNSILNMVMKFPFCFPSLINLTLAFSHFYSIGERRFFLVEFVFTRLFRSFYFLLLQEPYDLLFLILISIQLFIYIRFDLKIKAGFLRLFKNNNLV